MDEELENGITLLEDILQSYNTGKEYHIFFPRCAKENEEDIVYFPIFEENTHGTLTLKVWAKYNLETYILEGYIEPKSKIMLFDKKLTNFKKKKFAKNVIALYEIFYTAQDFMNLSEDSIEYIANQELLEEKIDDYKKLFKLVLADEELAIVYGVKKIEPVKQEVAKIPSQPAQATKKIDKKKELTIKELQECINKIDTKNSSKEKYMLKLMEEVGELARDINENKRMKNNKIEGTVEGEIADIIYYAVCLANVYGVNIEDCIYKKEKLNCKKYNRKNMFK